MASTTAVYLDLAKGRGFEPETITLPKGAQAHWIGRSSAKNTVVFFHGGGYVLPASPGCLDFLYDIKSTLDAGGSDTAILVLAYSLAPEARYPAQLEEAVELLRYLVQDQKQDPSNITVGGDSAGGNLALSLISHLSRPRPSIAPLHLSAKLQAAFLISPWVSFNVHTPAFKKSAEKDFLNGRILARWSGAFLGTTWPFAGDFYNEPVLAPAWWWGPAADVVHEVLIWGGANEILLDGIEEFARRFREGFQSKGGRLSTIITPRAAHEEMIIERSLGYIADSGTGSVDAVKRWAIARL